MELASSGRMKTANTERTSAQLVYHPSIDLEVPVGAAMATGALLLPPLR